MRVKTLITFILIISTFAACKKSSLDTAATETRLIINHYQRTALAIDPWIVHVAQAGNDIGTNNWGNLYENINGFTYEPGYIYDLNVIVKTYPNPSGNGTSTAVELIKVNNKVKAPDDTVFEIYLVINKMSFVTGNANTGFKILDKIGIDPGTLSNELTQALVANPTEVLGKFVHSPSGSYYLKELSVK
jgi:hypothetical protein